MPAGPAKRVRKFKRVSWPRVSFLEVLWRVLKHAPGAGAGGLSRRYGHAREQARYPNRCVIKLLRMDGQGPTAEIRESVAGRPC